MLFNIFLGGAELHDHDNGIHHDMGEYRHNNPFRLHIQERKGKAHGRIQQQVREVLMHNAENDGTDQSGEKEIRFFI